VRKRRPASGGREERDHEPGAIRELDVVLGCFPSAQRRTEDQKNSASLSCRREERRLRLPNRFLLERFQSRFSPLVNGHRFFEVNNLKDVFDRIAHSANAEKIGTLGGAAEVSNDHGDSARIDKRHLRKVEDERFRSDFGSLLEKSAQDRCEMEIDFAAQR
jgi:hypothetical protein